MDLTWKLLTGYMRGKTQYELAGITVEELQQLLRDELRQRLLYVEQIIFCEEMTCEEKVQTLVEWFAQQDREDNSP